MDTVSQVPVVLAPPDGVVSPPVVPAHLLAATLRCVALWGVSKTTLDDVAREAGVSRATVYRACPGGKDALLAAVVADEVRQLLHRVGDAIESASTVDDALVSAMVEVGSTLSGHEALRFLLRHEPELVLPRFAFGQLDEVLGAVRLHVGPLLACHLDGDLALGERVAEWVARITLSYTFSPARGVDTSDEKSVRSLVSTFVLPGIHHLKGDS